MSVMNHAVPALTPEELYPAQLARFAEVVPDSAPTVVKAESLLPRCRSCKGPARGPSYAPFCEDCWVAKYARCRESTSRLSKENRGI